MSILEKIFLTRRRFLQVAGAAGVAGMEITKAPASVQHSSGESL